VIESSSGACLDFWYHMKGNTTGNMTVYHRILDQQPTSLWSMKVMIGNKLNKKKSFFYLG
jgi:hypothetical protein